MLLSAPPPPRHRERTFEAALNGEPSRELRRAIDLNTQRDAGAFFTGSKLANQAVGRGQWNEEVVLDPACGAGDLLLAAARRFPMRRSLTATLNLWGEYLVGRDVHSSFVRATRARLAILALARGARHGGGRIPLAELLPMIRRGDGLKLDAGYSNADRILLNPPFKVVTVPARCSWASGTVTSAALFFESVLLKARRSTRVTAVLPDVLRSGSRARKWQNMVERSGRIRRVTRFGRFDADADIDVFILDLEKGQTNRGRQPYDWRQGAASAKTVGDLFTVGVGAVVPHRDPHKGPWFPYVHARALAPWDTLATPTENRRFLGTAHRGPFVAIRRTSRPGDAHRAVATLVATAKPVAVENHLMVCTPRDGKVSTCRHLVRVLKVVSTTEWLNARIRCRHLTVSAVGDIPWL